MGSIAKKVACSFNAKLQAVRMHKDFSPKKEERGRVLTKCVETMRAVYIVGTDIRRHSVFGVYMIKHH